MSAFVQKYTCPLQKGLQENRGQKRDPVGKKEKQNVLVEEITRHESVQEKTLVESQKAKGASNGPHPLDRRSGTGRGKEMRKDGAGRHNWGTFQEDLKFDVQYLSDSDIYDFIKAEDQPEAKDGELVKVKKDKKVIDVASPRSLKLNYRENPVEFHQDDFPQLC